MHKCLFLVFLLFTISCTSNKNKKSPVVENTDLISQNEDEKSEDEKSAPSEDEDPIEDPSENLSASSTRSAADDDENNVQSTSEVEDTVEKEEITDPNVASIYFEEPIYNFGYINEGDIVNAKFSYQNNGNADLIITNVLVDCGCTVTNFSKEPVSPKDPGDYIEVIFDSKGKIGEQERIITILSNGEPRSKIIKLIGIVNTN